MQQMIIQVVFFCFVFIDNGVTLANYDLKITELRLLSPDTPCRIHSTAALFQGQFLFSHVTDKLFLWEKEFTPATSTAVRVHIEALSNTN